MDRGIGIGEQAVVGVDQAAVALVLRHAVAEARPLGGVQAPDVAGDPLDLAARARGDREQHELADALGVGLRVREAERAAPRPAEHEPALDLELLAQPLDVGDQVLGRVVGQRVRAAAATPALVEHDDAVAGEVEVVGPPRRAARPRAAVQHDRRLASWITNHLPEDLVAVRGRHHASHDATR